MPLEKFIEFHGELPIDANCLNGLQIAGIYVPEEVLLEVFTNLCPKDVLSCSLVCKRWCNIAKSNALWQTLYNKTQYPAKAKTLPWYVFYCFFTTDNFKNLIRNGNGQEKFAHWTIVSNGGDKFKIEDTPDGSELLPIGVKEFNGHTSCFVTSYQRCSKFQKVDLTSKKLLRYILKKYKPTLYLSEWFTSRFDCSCIYTLAAHCDTEQLKWSPPEQIFHHFHRVSPGRRTETKPLVFVQEEIEQWSRKEWQKKEIQTNEYPDDIKAVYFWHEGQDRQFWAGHYGSKMAGGVLKFLFESIEPAVEDSEANDLEDLP